MTIAEKKIEMVQSLLQLENPVVLFEIERLLHSALGHAASAEASSNFDTWAAQFEDIELENADDFGFFATEIRQKIWEAERGPDMRLPDFFSRLAQK